MVLVNDGLSGTVIPAIFTYYFTALVGGARPRIAPVVSR